MITATKFTFTHSSFWKDSFPALESYIRVINSGAYERIFDECEVFIEAGRSYLISETAFCLAKNIAAKNSLDEAYNEARIRLNGLPGVIDDKIPLNELEVKAAIELANRLLKMIKIISPKNSPIEFDPSFAGCGALAKSNGDILAETLLIEVKSVDRNFRATDFRQLMTYLFQDLASGKSKIQEIGVVNPRRGIFYKANVEQFIFDTSATSILDVQNKFLSAIGCGGVSR